MHYDIAVLPGDGIGPEVIASALRVLDAAAIAEDIVLGWTEHPAGSALYRDTGESLPASTLARAEAAHAVLLGAMGLPEVRRPDGTEEGPQVALRDAWHLFASLRPCLRLPNVPSRVDARNVDVLVIRETTEGLFAGRQDPPGDDPDSASDRMTITRATSLELFELAFREARRRRDTVGTAGRVTLFDKANALRSQAFLRALFDEVAARHPDLQSERIYIDAGTMLLVTQPERFDVVVAENIFGDIASEVAAGVVGGLGVAPSADLGRGRGVFQPCHGSAPDIAGLGVANPIATILAAAMLLDWLGEEHADARCAAAAARIREAVRATLGDGVRTPDLGGTATTQEVTLAVVAHVERGSAVAVTVGRSA